MTKANSVVTIEENRNYLNLSNYDYYYFQFFFYWPTFPELLQVKPVPRNKLLGIVGEGTALFTYRQQQHQRSNLFKPSTTSMTTSPAREASF